MKEAKVAKALEANASLKEQVTSQSDLVKSYDEEVKLLQAQEEDREKLVKELNDDSVRVAEGFTELREETKQTQSER